MDEKLADIPLDSDVTPPAGGYSETTNVEEEDPDEPSVASLANFSSRAFPNSVELCNDPRINPIPIGFLVSPLAKLNQPPPLFPVGTKPATCKGCSCYLNPHVSVVPAPTVGSVREWTCSFCGEVNPLKDQCGVDAHFELKDEVVEFIEEKTPSELAPPFSRTCVFVIDRSALALAKGLYDAISAVFDSLIEVPTVSIGLVIFSSTVGLYDTTAAEVAQASVISGSRVPDEDDFSFLGLRGCDILDDKQQPSQLQRKFIGNMNDCRENLLQILSVLESSKVQPSHVTKDGDREASRCLGVATHIALSMIKGSGTHGDVIICTAGAPNFGPGGHSENEKNSKESHKYLSALGRAAHEYFIAISTFCIGTSSFGIPLIRELVSPTGGTVIFHKSCDSSFMMDFHRAVFSWFGTDGRLNVFTSPALAITRVIGAISEMPDDMDDSSYTFSLNCLSPFESVTFYAELDEDLSEEYFHFQFVVSWTNEMQQRVFRVATYRVRSTGSLTNYVKYIDSNVASVLVAKLAVLDSFQNSDEEFTAETKVHEDLDSQVRSIFVGFGKDLSQAQHESDELNLQKLQLDPNVESLPLMIYHLQRGPLLGTILQNQDEKLVYRALFLRANYEDCVRMVLPSLLSFNSTGDFEELPLSNLALQPNRILLLDHHTHIFLWSGEEVTGIEFDAFREACEQRASDSSKYRFPSPEIILTEERDQNEHFLSSRLTPCHNDSITQQNLYFPQLDQLQPHIRSKLLEKFSKNMDLSYHKYLEFILR